MMADVSIDTIVNLCKRRGVVFPSSEIYGGLRSAWDWGPLGIELKRNVKNEWWRAIVHERNDVVGLESSILMSPKVWEASGHVATFTDPLVECTSCHRRYRADHISLDRPCPNCGNGPAWTDPRHFNLMFKTYMGPVEDSAHIVYLRPETAQGMFVDFMTVQASSRKRIPFGIAQQGKSFRNEITPGNFVFRTREFEQMEMEFFVKPGTDDEWHDYWLEERMRWYTDLGMRSENLRLREHDEDELSHYAKRTFDIEYNFPGMGWSELEGIANRTDFDLKAHAEHSGQDLSYFDSEADERYVPYVIEPAVGVERPTFAFLIDAYAEEEAPTASGKLEKRVVLKLDSRLAPSKVAVLPLSKHADLTPVAEKLSADVRKRFVTDFDVTGSIGKRYRRQDEVGTPFCVTVDFDTLTDNQVTVRDRDTMEQERIPMEGLVDFLVKRLTS
ncbi:MAG TPA: glycine--tRNA ligase [Actinomycetota bacterium]|jgi:glycyl-tRNA synthetase|nr:glycine--tRNA ligase [Actinomycetota bacterium]